MTRLGPIELYAFRIQPEHAFELHATADHWRQRSDLYCAQVGLTLAFLRGFTVLVRVGLHV